MKTHNSYLIKQLEPENFGHWDSYVEKHSGGNLFHLSSWKEIFESSYGLTPYYLYASTASAMSGESGSDDAHTIKGILPLVLMRSLSLKKIMVSLPFLDHAGVVADEPEISASLLGHALAFAKKEGVSFCEIRQLTEVSYALEALSQLKDEGGVGDFPVAERLDLSLPLPCDSRELWESFRSKMRTKIRQPEKMGGYVIRGGRELVDEFYEIFAINMRRLGSPVHSRKFFENIANKFGENFNIFVVRYNKKSLASAVGIVHKNVMYNPWASSLREYGKLRPNWLLYWEMLKYAADLPGCTRFDFGRSSPGSGTHDFKKQWGAEESRLCWVGFSHNASSLMEADQSKSMKFQFLSQCWQHIPLALTTICGPYIRKHISL